MTDLKVGDIVLFRGKGFVFSVFNALLCLLDSFWRSQPKPRYWHMGIAWQKGGGGWIILEGYSPSVRVHFYTHKELQNTLWFSWLDKTPTDSFQKKFYKKYIGKKYDVAIYFWTMFQYLIRHYFNRRIPRLLDDRFTCWELGDAFADELDKPWQDEYDCVLLQDFLKACIREKIEGVEHFGDG
jgi:hypothetical protein